MYGELGILVYYEYKTKSTRGNCDTTITITIIIIIIPIIIIITSSSLSKLSLLPSSNQDHIITFECGNLINKMTAQS